MENSLTFGVLGLVAIVAIVGMLTMFTGDVVSSSDSNITGHAMQIKDYANANLSTREVSCNDIYVAALDSCDAAWGASYNGGDINGDQYAEGINTCYDNAACLNTQCLGGSCQMSQYR